MAERTGARLRVAGADPLSVRWLARRERFSLDAVDLLGGLYEDELTREIQTASLLAAPAPGGESFGMVLTRAFAASTPAVASDIEGYAAVATPESAVLVPPGDPDALADALIELLEDEPRRQAREGRAQGGGGLFVGADCAATPVHLRGAGEPRGQRKGRRLMRVPGPRTRWGRLRSWCSRSSGQLHSSSGTGPRRR